MDEQYTQDSCKGSKSVLGMPVYSIQEGQNLGQVKTILIDAREKRLLALVVEKKRLTKEERLLPFEAVKSVGDDVVTVERGQSLERRNADPAIMRALRRPVQPLGARCFTASGKTMGKVEEYYFDTQDGRIAQLEISEGGPFKSRMLVLGEHIIALAPHTVMLADEALINSRPVENNLLSSMEVARDKAASISRSTVSLLNNSLSKIKGVPKEEAQDVAEAESLQEAIYAAPEDNAQTAENPADIVEIAEATAATTESTAEEADAIVENAAEEVDATAESSQEEATAAIEESAEEELSAETAKGAAEEQQQVVAKFPLLAVEVLLPAEAEQEPGQPLYAAPPGIMAVEEEPLTSSD